MTKGKKTLFTFLTGLLTLSSVITFSYFSISDNGPFNITQGATQVEELENKIDNRNQKIEDLEKEIHRYETQINEVDKQANSLESTISSLTANQRKLEAEYQVTQNKINSTNYQIEKLALDIEHNKEDIQSNINTIKTILRQMNEADDVSLIESFLKYEDVTRMWEDVEVLRQFHQSINGQLDNLRAVKKELVKTRQQRQAQRQELMSLQEELKNKQAVIDASRKEQNKLLTQTENKQENYEAIVAEKKRQKEQFQQQLFEFESQLQIAIDPSSIPSTGKGVLSWPLNNIRITQRFGRTSASGRLYAAGTHNGVDFGTSIGTPVKATRQGTIVGVGNTDLQNGCYSYGKWILIEHDNGISSIYGHLSVIKASRGQTVRRGQVIGYSGNSGYSTGPHLHLGVYATQGVRIQQYTQSNHCTQVSIPIADRDAYLDPLSYI